ncbi:MAG: DUF4153 domain-containing protein [Pyrinomonadaceae bacterium]
MTTRTRTGLEILGTAAVVGVLGNVLLRETPWGLNAFLFVTAFVTGLVVLIKRHRPELRTKTNVAISAAMVFFASMYLIRDAEELMVWDTFAIIILMGVMLLGNFRLKAHISGAFHYVTSVIYAGITSAIGPFLLLGSDIDWKQMPGNKLSQHTFAVLRGLAIAMPLLLIFGALFMAADAAFEGLVNRTFNFNIDTVVSHFLLTSFFAWLTAGYFRGSLMAPFANGPRTSASTSPIPQADAPQAETRPSGSVSDAAENQPQSFVAKVAAEPGESGPALPNNASILEHINISDPPDWSGKHPCLPEEEIRTEVGSQAGMLAAPVKARDWQSLDSASLPSVFTLGTTETVLILGLVNLLFLAFVIVQVPYLFGGMEFIQNTPDFKLADYARRGFGELVAVAALVLPMLLLSHWLIRKDGSKVGGIYKIFAGIQIALLFVIMASAVQRLVLLTGELGYGMTTVRFYPMVFMTWLAVVFVWFAVTVLRNNRNYFAWGALWSAVLILGATNLMNPEKFIVETNLRLMHQGREFDASYNANLSDDALPTLINSFDRLNSDDAVTALREFERRACMKRQEGDWRTWNFSRQKASAALNATGINAEGCVDHYGD